MEQEKNRKMKKLLLLLLITFTIGCNKDDNDTELISAGTHPIVGIWEYTLFNTWDTEGPNNICVQTREVAGGPNSCYETLEFTSTGKSIFKAICPGRFGDESGISDYTVLGNTLTAIYLDEKIVSTFRISGDKLTLVVPAGDCIGKFDEVILRKLN